MSTEYLVLLSNAADDSQPSIWQYSTKNKAAGYQKNNSSIHTLVVDFDNFKGTVKIQGTLELYPGDLDWVDITLVDPATNLTSPLDSLDSTPLVANATRNFTGKFVYIRAAYQLTEGTITEIRYNY